MIQQDPNKHQIDKVIQDERVRIIERREYVEAKTKDDFLTRQDTTSRKENDSTAPKDLVGVALSGGGMRAACFSLGVIQAMAKAKLWRFVDFMSTVSGGGYTGALVSSNIAKEKDVSGIDLPFLDSKNGRHPPLVRQLTQGGQFLKRPVQLFNKYFIGIILVNLPLTLGLVSVSALIAFLWRSLDYPFLREPIKASILGYHDDLLTPFIPSLFLFLLWLGTWVLSYFKNGAEAAAKYGRGLLACFLVSVLIGFAILFGNGDLGIPLGLSKDFAKDSVTLPQSFSTVVFGLLVGALLPLLKPKRLLQSGLQPQAWWERHVFSVTSLAVVVGVPVVVVALLAKENISGEYERPDREISAFDIKDSWWPIPVSFVLSENDCTGQSNTVPLKSLAEYRKKFLGLSQMKEWKTIYRDGKKAHVQVPLNEYEVETELREDKFDWRFIYAGTETSTNPQNSLSEGPVGEGQAKYLSVLKERCSATVFSSIRRMSPTPTLKEAEKNRTLENFDRILDDFVESPNFVSELELKQIALGLRLSISEFRAVEENYLKEHPWVIDRSLDMFCIPWLSMSPSDSQKYLDSKAKMRGFMHLFAWAIECRFQSESLLGCSIELPIDEEAKSQSDLLALNFGKGVATKFLDPDDRRLVNKSVFDHMVPGVFRSDPAPQRRIVIHSDQTLRLQIAGWCFFFALLSMAVIDLNATSMHRFYRNKLAKAFIAPRNTKIHSPLIDELNNCDFGGAYHLINAKVSFLTFPWRETDYSTNSEKLASFNYPNDQLFLVSEKACGCQTTGYQSPEMFQDLLYRETSRVDLAEATALSGAALSPGRHGQFLVALLSYMLNLRLGQWLPIPGSKKHKFWPTLLNVVWDGHRKNDRSYCFVSDGGHFENLGLLPLIQRQCKVIFLVDAGADPDGNFDELSNVMRMCRHSIGVRFFSLDGTKELSNRELSNLTSCTSDDETFKATDNSEQPSNNSKSPETLNISSQHFCAVRIRYPKPNSLVQDSDNVPHEPQSEEDGLLIYIKPSLTGDEPLDVLQYAKRNPTFPHDSTGDQFFEPEQVESYRALGEHCFNSIVERLGSNKDGNAFYKFRDVLGQLTGEFGSTKSFDGIEKLFSHEYENGGTEIKRKARKTAKGGTKKG